MMRSIANPIKVNITAGSSDTKLQRLPIVATCLLVRRVQSERSKLLEKCLNDSANQMIIRPDFKTKIRKLLIITDKITQPKGQFRTLKLFIVNAAKSASAAIFLRERIELASSPSRYSD
uniref:Uncharacterized protein n=1 Tax=Romanomermis culicivorax TaxID=13658 RepID=A0A915JCG6_ROMCU